MSRHHPRMAQWYQDYLCGEHWLGLRAHLIEKRGQVCEDCGGSWGRIYLHHITYARLGHERHADLRFLCDRCHRRAHKTHNIPYLFLIYREDYKERVLPVLRAARRDADFEYPCLR